MTGQTAPTPNANAPTRMPIAEWIFTAVVVIVEAISMLASPGYMRPFLSLPIGIAVMIVAFGWQAIGLLFICLPKSPMLNWPAIARWSIVPMFFVVPVFVVIMLGPALVTIATALGPVMK